MEIRRSRAILTYDNKEDFIFFLFLMPLLNILYLNKKVSHFVANTHFVTGWIHSYYCCGRKTKKWRHANLKKFISHSTTLVVVVVCLWCWKNTESVIRLANFFLRKSIYYIWHAKQKKTHSRFSLNSTYFVCFLCLCDNCFRFLCFVKMDLYFIMEYYHATHAKYPSFFQCQFLSESKKRPTYEKYLCMFCTSKRILLLYIFCICVFWCGQRKSTEKTLDIFMITFRKNMHFQTSVRTIIIYSRIYNFQDIYIYTIFIQKNRREKINYRQFFTHPFIWHELQGHNNKRNVRGEKNDASFSIVTSIGYRVVLPQAISCFYQITFSCNRCDWCESKKWVSIFYDTWYVFCSAPFHNV